MRTITLAHNPDIERFGDLRKSVMIKELARTAEKVTNADKTKATETLEQALSNLA
jgi:hypothetical protein